MDKISKLQKEIEDLKLKKEEAERLIKEAEDKTQQNYKKICEEFKNFFINKRNEQFVLIDRFPNMEALNLYARRSGEFPLYSDGELSAIELAAIIKHLYQFKRQQEYKILTIGATERDGEPVYGGQVFSAKPHLYFLIGNEQTLEPFISHNGQYENYWRMYNKIYLEAKGKDLISLELDRTWDAHSKKKLDIECYTETQFDEIRSTINYYDFEESRYKTFDVSNTKNIFSRNLRSSLNCSKKASIKDVMDFKIHIDDTFIAKVLISIIIYKRNNEIKELCEEDYNYIFKTLFNEEVDIIGDAKKDIPKRLVYVPNPEEEKKNHSIFVVDPRK